MTHAEKCRVVGCKRDADAAWEPGMGRHGTTVPVCEFHYWRKLWWYKGVIFDHTEDGIASE